MPAIRPPALRGKSRHSRERENLLEVGPRFRGDEAVSKFHVYGWAAGPCPLMRRRRESAKNRESNVLNAATGDFFPSLTTLFAGISQAAATSTNSASDPPEIW